MDGVYVMSNIMMFAGIACIALGSTTFNVVMHFSTFNVCKMKGR